MDKLSQKLSQKRRPPGKNLADILLREHRESESKLQILQQAKQQKEMENCTFTPLISRSCSVKDIVLGFLANSPKSVKGLGDDEGFLFTDYEV